MPAGQPARVSYFFQVYSEETDPIVLASCSLQIVDGSGNVLKNLKTHTSMDVDHLNWGAESFDISDLSEAADQNAAFQAVSYAA